MKEAKLGIEELQDLLAQNKESRSNFNMSSLRGFKLSPDSCIYFHFNNTIISYLGLIENLFTYFFKKN